MPRLPSTTELVPDSRLDVYRGRAAVLIHAGHLVGYLLVSSEYLADHLGGRSWWCRWSPFTEIAVVHLRLFDRAPTQTFWLDGADLQAELHSWATGTTGLAHHPVKVRWLPDDQTAEALVEEFQLTLDQHHRTIPTN